VCAQKRKIRKRRRERRASALWCNLKQSDNISITNGSEGRIKIEKYFGAPSRLKEPDLRGKNVIGFAGSATRRTFVCVVLAVGRKSRRLMAGVARERNAFLRVCVCASIAAARTPFIYIVPAAPDRPSTWSRTSACIAAALGEKKMKLASAY